MSNIITIDTSGGPLSSIWLGDELWISLKDMAKVADVNDQTVVKRVVHTAEVRKIDFNRTRAENAISSINAIVYFSRIQSKDLISRETLVSAIIHTREKAFKQREGLKAKELNEAIELYKLSMTQYQLKGLAQFQAENKANQYVINKTGIDLQKEFPV